MFCPVPARSASAGAGKTRRLRFAPGIDRCYRSAVLPCDIDVTCRMAVVGASAEFEDERSSEQAYSGSSGLRGGTGLAIGEIRPSCPCLGRVLLPGTDARRL